MMTIKPPPGFWSVRPLIPKFSRKPKINLGGWREQDSMFQRDPKRKKRMLSFSIQLEMAKYRISPRTVGSTLQNNVNDVRGLFLGNHRGSP